MSSHELPNSTWIMEYGEVARVTKRLREQNHIPWVRWIEEKYRQLEERVSRRRVPREAPIGCRYGMYRSERAIRRGGGIELKVQLKLVRTRTYFGDLAGVVE